MVCWSSWDVDERRAHEIFCYESEGDRLAGGVDFC
jgi:hypothetical protein